MYKKDIKKLTTEDRGDNMMNRNLYKLEYNKRYLKLD